MLAPNHQIMLKNYNRRAVLNIIRKKGVVTKAALAEMTGLTFMSIKRILSELESLGLLIGIGYMKGNGVGRKSIPYAINENCRYTIGVYINKFITSIAAVNLRGNICYMEQICIDWEMSTQSDFVMLLTKHIEDVIRESGVVKEKVLGIGIGAPGPVDCEKGIILTPPNIPLLHYLPLENILEEKIGLPVYLNKDTNVIAFGEYWYGGKEDISDLFYIDVDMGIGSGFVIDGKINIGYNSIAGEIGHSMIDPSGPRCNCGNKGCLEAMSSGIAILKEIKREIDNMPEHALYARKETLTLEDVFNMRSRNDSIAISALNRSAYYVGIAVANIINILDPPVVSLGGILVQRATDYFSVVADVAYRKIIKGTKNNQIMISKLGDRAGVIGAAEVVADQFFNEQVNNVLSGSNG